MLGHWQEPRTETSTCAAVEIASSVVPVSGSVVAVLPADATRGQWELQLEAVDRLARGDWVRLTMSDPPKGSDGAGSLMSHLYQGPRRRGFRPHVLAAANSAAAVPDPHLSVQSLGYPALGCAAVLTVVHIRRPTSSAIYAVQLRPPPVSELGQCCTELFSTVIAATGS